VLIQVITKRNLFKTMLFVNMPDRTSWLKL